MRSFFRQIKFCNRKNSLELFLWYPTSFKIYLKLKLCPNTLWYTYNIKAWKSIFTNTTTYMTYREPLFYGSSWQLCNKNGNCKLSDFLRKISWNQKISWNNLILKDSHKIGKNFRENITNENLFRILKFVKLLFFRKSSENIWLCHFHVILRFSVWQP